MGFNDDSEYMVGLRVYAFEFSYPEYSVAPSETVELIDIESKVIHYDYSLLDPSATHSIEYTVLSTNPRTSLSTLQSHSLSIAYSVIISTPSLYLARPTSSLTWSVYSSPTPSSLYTDYALAVTYTPKPYITDVDSVHVWDGQQAYLTV